MTDRIKQMAEEADAYADEIHNRMLKRTLRDSTWHNTRDAKFAALVAEDCAKVVLSRGRVYGFSQGISPPVPSQPMSADGIAQTIRARYGIKGE